MNGPGAGLWPSPLTPEPLVAGAVGINEAIPDGDTVWWAESRPAEGGRTAIMRRSVPADAAQEVLAAVEITPKDTNVRTTVHEYGGGSWWASNGVLWYSEYRDQRIYRIETQGANVFVPIALTADPPATSAWRYADIRPTADLRWLIAVMERHEKDGQEPENLLVAIANDGSKRCVELAAGADFYGSPRISPDGASLAWIQWQHPNMPWDVTSLHVAKLDLDGELPRLEKQQHVAGGDDANVAIVQPEWSPDGRLHYLSDAHTAHGDGWQLYVAGVDDPVHVVDGELGYPPWVFGLSRYAFKADGSVVGARFAGGLEYLDGSGFDTSAHSAFHAIRSDGERLAWVAASFSTGASVMADGHTVAAPRPLDLDEAFFPAPERLNYPTGSTEQVDAGTSRESAYALYYAPANPDSALGVGERAPLVVMAHGGPTSAARSQLNLGIRFWTSRGFGVVDVNYRGSSGFGRAYRKRLDGNWGITDVEDCVAAARYLVQRGDADPERLIIRGGSAGGFTVLCALAFHDTFTAGASLYGVADLEALAGDTHKFESRYLDSLVGPYPQAKNTYIARSPIHHLDSFNTPMIVLQGSEDKIVPPNQSRMIVAALEARGVTVEYHEFEGEQHGFRQAATIIKALQSELDFYTRLFNS
jgi:dipeptidyl aminopeptidase/acylaminoacyl peptidase